MTTRLALFDLIVRTGMDAEKASRLWRLAGFEGMPPRALAHFRRGLMVGGVGCAGLGLLFWVAANWGLLSRVQQFGLLQVLVLLSCVGLAVYPRAGAALGLLAMLATGGLFAYFGQTYQTGADPWQLFALWAVLTLPLACCARADTVWAAWALVALTAIALYERAYAGDAGYARRGPVTMIASGGAVMLTAFFHTIARRYLGARDWAFGLCMILTAAGMTATALYNVSVHGWLPGYGFYWFCVLVAGAAGALLAHAKPFDVFPASVVALCLNILLVGGLANILLSGTADHWIVSLLILGLSAAALLGGSVKIILGLAHPDTSHPQAEDQA